MTNIQLENIHHMERLTPDQHKLLDLIRRLESSHFIFATDPKVATNLAKAHHGSPSDKLLYRASLMDQQGKLQKALHKGDFLVKSVGRVYAALSFVLGFVGVFGLLSTHVINFFYVLLGLLGWHTVALLWWLIRLGSTNTYVAIYGLLDKLRPKSVIEAQAFDIHLEEFQKNTVWQLSRVIHKAWLCGLLGSVLALFVLFLFKSYAFIWESTLLTQEHFALILTFFGFIPSLFGFEMPSQISLSRGDVPPARLAILMMMSVVVYGMIPRLCAYLLCQMKGRERFVIDTHLYYYEHLIRTFNHTITDKDDYVPSTPKHAKVTPLNSANPYDMAPKVVATLERAYDDDRWHEPLYSIKNMGVVDDKQEIMALIQTANALGAQIVLGVDSRILPDRGVLRKVDLICQNSNYGVLVRFLEDNGYMDEWRHALSERHVSHLSD